MRKLLKSRIVIVNGRFSAHLERINTVAPTDAGIIALTVIRDRVLWRCDCVTGISKCRLIDHASQMMDSALFRTRWCLYKFSGLECHLLRCQLQC